MGKVLISIVKPLFIIIKFNALSNELKRRYYIYALVKR